MISNYEKTRVLMQEKFLEYDQEKMIQRFGLKADERYLVFDFLGAACRVGRKDGLVECADPVTGNYHTGSFDEAMTVYDLLCWSREYARSSGEYVNLHSLHNAASAPSSGGMFGRNAQEFACREEELAHALEILGEGPDVKGDLSAKIHVFYDMDMLLRFWRADEDFPAEIHFLFDANVLQYMHYETVWYAACVIVRRLQDLMGTEPEKRNR